jgi:hypothetical protein
MRRTPLFPQVDSLRKALQEVGKAYANRAAKAPTKAAAVEAAEEGTDMLSKVAWQLRGRAFWRRPGLRWAAAQSQDPAGRSSCFSF